jgi:CheY-like chemotaxis protein
MDDQPKRKRIQVLLCRAAKKMRRRKSNYGRKVIEPGNKGMAFASSLMMKRRILIADDDPAIRDIFKMIFERAGYSVELKENGRDIFENNYKLPHIFLIDKQLSGSDGLSLCRYLKGNESTKHIPVIMVSASPDIGPLSQQAGADDYVEKPFDLNYLLKLIDKHVNHARERSMREF